MEKVIFTRGWQEFFQKFGMDCFELIFNCSNAKIVNKNKKRDVRTFSLGLDGDRKIFFMKRFFRPHYKDMIFAFRNFGRICSQAELERENANILLKNNFETYRPVCYGAKFKWGLENRSFLITEKLKGQPLTEFVAKKWTSLTQAERENIIISLARLIRRIHDTAVSMPDLYIWHIFVSQNHAKDRYEFAIIDLHRMIHNVTGTDKQIRDLAAMDYSMLEKYFDSDIKKLFINSYLRDDWPGNKERFIKKIKKCSKALARKRRHKPDY